LDLGKNKDREVVQRLLQYHHTNQHNTSFRNIRFAAEPAHTPTANKVPCLFLTVLYFARDMSIHN